MSDLVRNLAAAWEARADREANLPTWRAPGLFKPEEIERSTSDFQRAVTWFRYWSRADAS